MNKVKTLGRAFIWVLLALVLIGMVGTVTQLGREVVLLLIDTWRGSHGTGSLAVADPETSGRLVGAVLGQIVVLLVFGWISFKVFRWLRPRRGKADRIMAGLVALLCLAAMLNALTSQDIFRSRKKEVMKATQQTVPAAA